MVDFFGKFNSGIMLAGIFIFWWGGAIGKLMIIGYSLVWVTITEIVNCLICFILKKIKIKAKRIMKNKIF